MAVPAKHTSQRATRWVGLHIVARDRLFAHTLFLWIALETLRLAFLGRRPKLPWLLPSDRADVLVYAFDGAELHDPCFVENRIAAIQREPARSRIFLQLASSEVHGEVRSDIDRKNRMIEDMARRCGAHVVAMTDLMRSGAARRLKKSGKPNSYGYLSIAHMVIRAINVRSLRAGVAARGNDGHAGSLIAEAPTVQAVLAHLTWPKSRLPRSLDRSYPRDSIADFVDGIVSFPGWAEWGKFPLGSPIDWSMAGANWSWQSYFTGLEFLRPALSLVWDAANGARLPPNLLQVLDDRSMSAEHVFAKLSFIIGDFVRGNPPTAPANQRAYFQGTICRRVRVILTFLLCCKKRAKQGFPIDGDDLKLAVQHLVQCFEMLRSDEVYPKAGNHGVRQDALFILAGLLLPQLDYGITLMDIGIGRLKRHQLGKALSPDGVWLENSFGYHCLIINVLTTLAADLRIAGGPESDFIHDALKRMLPFAEALIKFDGSSPLIGDTAPERHFPTIAAARQEIALAEDREATAAPIALAEFRRDKSTSYFPKAGYFVSHTDREMSQHASSVIFFATLSTPKHKHSDDLSVLFNHGATDLLIDGGTFNKEISDTVRNAARFDPGTHNTFRVNSQGYPLRPVPGMSAAGLAGVWEEAGWAAARGYNQAYPDGRIERTVIHLKAHHAVIVLDRLFSKTSREVLFEQFWHVSPDFSDVQQRQGFSPVFSSKRYGHLLCAFDAEGSAVSIESGSKENPIAWAMRPDKSIVPTPYVRRAITCHAGIAASLFQWSEVPGDMLVTFECKDAETVQLNAKGIAFTSRYQIAKNAVICQSLESDDAALVEMPA